MSKPLVASGSLPGSSRRVWLVLALACSWLALASLASPRWAHALGAATAVDIRMVELASREPMPRPLAAQRLAWELRQRSSVETRLEPTRSRFDDPRVFESPLLYWIGDRAFPQLSDPELTGLKRFVEFGGALIIDDAAPDRDGFDASIRRELARAFGPGALVPLPGTHTVYRSFYLLSRPVGRVQGPEHLEAVMRGERAAVIYSRHDLGGAYERDNVGTYLHAVDPGGETQREAAIRLGVNLVLYALCLDYKDDQVHAPFIMRRRAGQR